MAVAGVSAARHFIFVEEGDASKVGEKKGGWKKHTCTEATRGGVGD